METTGRDIDIVTSRVFNAPRERVFEAFSDPEQLKQWWGPNGFTNTFEEFDFRSGGKWRFVMHGPDGKDYPNLSEFAEIDRPACIVLAHLVYPLYKTTMLFEDEENNTRLTWQTRFEDVPESEKFLAFIRAANEENFDRLAAVLGNQ